jgi:hypothetical protein
MKVARSSHSSSTRDVLPYNEILFYHFFHAVFFALCIASPSQTLSSLLDSKYRSRQSSHLGRWQVNKQVEARSASQQREQKASRHL